ncbi:hypothetical protein PG997_000422 [Apiospora hydei]|uniref:Biogenesis of lysosome-related organelles complex 1 subunit 1 n=1 Tax=Apiospora hydei TaxID=1337664 RepID=A0ABR1XAY3_9PEZI
MSTSAAAAAAAGPSSTPAPPGPKSAAGVTTSVSAATAFGSKPITMPPSSSTPSGAAAGPENNAASAPAASSSYTHAAASSPLSPLSPRTSVAQAKATTVTASGTTSIPSPSSTTAGILPSPALSSPSFPSYATSSSSRAAGPSGTAAGMSQQQQQTPRSHTGPPPATAPAKPPALEYLELEHLPARPPPTPVPTCPLTRPPPSTTTTLHMTEARDALVATMSNLFDAELQSRASLLHSNATQLSRQESDVAKATEALRKENDKLAKVARDAGRRIKETGNVQNWAEVLERDFLVLEETLRGTGRGAAVAAKVAGKKASTTKSLDEGGLVGAVNDMDIDDAVGADAGVGPSATGKTVEEVVVQDAGDRAGEDNNKPLATMDVDVNDTSGTPPATVPGPSGKYAGEDHEMEGNDGPFSHVDNAIEASIRGGHGDQHARRPEGSGGALRDDARGRLDVERAQEGQGDSRL